MFKAIVTGDWHFRGTNPVARLDNFQAALTEKVWDVYRIAIEQGAQAIIVPGDLFDSPSVSWGTAADLAALLQNAPCRVLAISGNHDVWGANVESKERTPFGFLCRLGLVYDMGAEPYEHNILGSVPIAVSGHGFTVETDTEAGMIQFTPAFHLPGCCPPGEEWEGKAIHIVHSMLLDKPPGFEGMRHTLISDVKTSADVIISGHEHAGFGVVERADGKVFINPGALCRLSAHESELEREVHVAVLEVSEDGVSVELVPVEAARPGYEVLSREHIEAIKDRDARLEKFMGLLASEGEGKFMMAREIVEDISARDALPAEVKTDALRRIAEARERLALGAGAAEREGGSNLNDHSDTE